MWKYYHTKDKAYTYYHYKMKFSVVDSKYVPKKGSEHSAGYDLVACLDRKHAQTFSDQHSLYSTINSGIRINPGASVNIDTGLRGAIDRGYYGRVAPRSGLAARNSIDVLAGVIDSDYRGNIIVILINHGKESVVIRDGERIAQLIIEKIYEGEFEQVEDVNNVGAPTARGADGFGSTGMNTL